MNNEQINQLENQINILNERVNNLEIFNKSQTPEYQQDVFDQVLLKLEASNGLGIGTRLAQESPMLFDVQSSNKGVRFPMMTTTLRDAIKAVNGLVIYNTTTSYYNFYNGTTWLELKPQLPIYARLYASTTTSVTVASTSITLDGLGSTSGNISNNTTANKITIAVAGYYQINAAIDFPGSATSGTYRIRIKGGASGTTIIAEKQHQSNINNNQGVFCATCAFFDVGWEIGMSAIAASTQNCTTGSTFTYLEAIMISAT